jgi:hypothetical protein
MPLRGTFGQRLFAAASAMFGGAGGATGVGALELAGEDLTTFLVAEDQSAFLVAEKI